MNHPLRTALLAAAATLVLAACKKDEAAPVTPTLPLAVGSTWEYARYRYTPTGGLRDSTTFTRRVVRDTVINQVTWYVLDNDLIVRNEARGYVRHDNFGQEPVVIYSHPSTPTNLSYGYDYPNYRLWVRTLNSAALAPVPDSRGRYSAYRYAIEYQYEYPGVSVPEVQKIDDYVNPEIGLVCQDVYYRDLPTVLQQRDELIRYQLR